MQIEDEEQLRDFECSVATIESSLAKIEAYLDSDQVTVKSAQVRAALSPVCKERSGSNAAL